MNVSWHFASFLLLLGGCSGELFGFMKNQQEFNVDDFEYEGDPMAVSCVYDENAIEFHQEIFNGTSDLSAALVERMNNGKSLSLYFDGMISHIKANGSTFKFAKEWFKASNSNICYFTYAYAQMPIGTVNTWMATREMVKSHRLHYVAKVARDLVLNIRDQCLHNGTEGCLRNMSQVTVLGFSFGAHFASQACLYLFEKTDEKVGILVGIDPAGISLILWEFNQTFIKQGDAAYVQIIHTDPWILGTMFITGDADIIVDDIPTSAINKHAFAVYLHMATSMKKLLLIASLQGPGKVIQIDPNAHQERRTVKQNEIIVGVYSEIDNNNYNTKRGKNFRISFENLGKILRDSIAHVVKANLN